MRVILI